jgi:hypothetical protein
MLRTISIVVFCLLAELAWASFELEDPAKILKKDVDALGKPVASAEGDSAQAVDATYLIMGEGTISCGEYVASSQAQEQMYFSALNWVQGFMTAINIKRSEEIGKPSLIGNDLDPDSASLWLEKYCRENPLNRLDDAALALVDELIAREKE